MDLVGVLLGRFGPGHQLGGLLLLAWWAVLIVAALAALVAVVAVLRLAGRVAAAFWRGLTGRNARAADPADG
jgi:hypothetical protein